MLRFKIFFTLFLGLAISLNAGDNPHGPDGHDHDPEHVSGVHENACGFQVGEAEYNPGKVAFHHISDQNIYSIGPWHFPLPCMMYVPGEGWDFFSSGKFHADYHGLGAYAYNGYVLYDGSVRRVTDAGFPDGLVELEGHGSLFVQEMPGPKGKPRDVVSVCHGGKVFTCDNKSTADGGMLGGGVTSFYDFSITKNVFSMIFIFLFLSFIFLKMAKSYKVREGKAPSGMQSFMEPLFLFVQDEVAKPFLGHKWERFLPFLLALFFFILGLNLFGQIPFLGASNVTGNLSVTMALAILAFIMTNFNGNKHYWGHTLWMPGVPAALKALIITPVEILGLFIKPLTLMLRLFGNMTAGHMVIAIFVGLIFVFGKSGELVGTSLGTAVGSTLLTLFMMAIELLVAFIQAYVFAMLTASYIGAAVEEAHH